MKIKDIALSAAAIGERVVKAIAIGAKEVWSAIKYIIFKDKVVEQICAENWGDGVGLSEEDAAKITSIGTEFKGNTEIVSFDEFSKFTGVTSIAMYAFENCENLESIDLSSVKTIIYGMFRYDKKLSAIGDISQVTSIQQYAFYQNESLSIDLELLNVKQILALAFQESGVKSLNAPKLNTLEAAFTKSAIERIVSIGSVKKVSGFTNCLNLRNVNLPSGMEEILPSAFQNCPIEGDLVIDAVEIGNSAFRNHKLSSITFINTVSIGTEKANHDQGCFGNGTNLTSVSFPDTIKLLHAGCFHKCTNLIIEELRLPNAEEVCNYAFGYTKTKKVKDLGSVTYIGIETFGYCGELDEVILPQTVTEIRDRAFTKCTKLEICIINAPTPPSLGSSVFGSTPSTMSIYVPDQSVQAYREASGWLSYADQIKPLSEYVEQ